MDWQRRSPPSGQGRGGLQKIDMQASIDTSDYTPSPHDLQLLFLKQRFGLSDQRAYLVATLAFGEGGAA